MTIKKKFFIALAVILFAGQMAYDSVFTINPGEQVILTRFGKVEKGPLKEPGYHFKLYRFDQVVRYPNKQIIVNIESTGCPPMMPVYKATASFIIVDPIKFYRTIDNIEYLQARLPYILKDNYCKDSISDSVTIASMSSYLKKELKEFGISVIKIDING